MLREAGLVNSFQNRFEYQNKKKESTFNLRRISFGARTYNATIGRFDEVDPLSDRREWLTQYNYVQNNPIVRIDPDGAFDDYALKDDGSVELIKKTDDKFDRLTASSGKEIKINKPTASSGSIISQLSKKDADGFSIGKTNNATDAINLYNFMDANTTRGIEFSLTGTMEKGKASYSVSTSHDLLSTNFDKINIEPLSLIFHIHNHDGPLDNGNVTSPSDVDLIKSTSMLNNVARSTSMFPRFFISLENGGLKEFYHSDKRSKNTKMNIKTIDLKNIKKYDYFKKKP